VSSSTPEVVETEAPVVVADTSDEAAAKSARRRTKKPRPTYPPGAVYPRSRGLVVGRIAGAPIVITPSWLLAAVVLTSIFYPTVTSFAPALSVTNAIMIALAFVLMLFVSVFLHEAAHALMARRFGGAVRELAVTLWGGHTAFTGSALRPGQSALIALVGPLTNLILAGILYAGYRTALPGTIPFLLCFAGFFSNMFVGLFNLLPGLPLDGGQILEAIVWKITGWRTRGTIVAGWIGRIVAALVLVWQFAVPLLQGRRPDLSSLIWMFLIASFLWSGAGQAIASARRREAVSGIHVRPLTKRAICINQGDSVANVRNLLTGMPEATGVVVDEAGRPLGRVNLEAALQVPPRVARSLAVESVIIPFPRGAEVSDQLSGFELLKHLDETCAGARIVPVIHDGHVAGVLDINMVANAIRAAA